jgi:hypothetical protein
MDRRLYSTNGQITSMNRTCYLWENSLESPRGKGTFFMIKYVAAFLWFVLMDVLRDYFMFPKILEYVVVGAGVLFIFQLFEKNSKKPN